MTPTTKTAVLVALVVFAVMVLVPIASFLLRAAFVAVVAGGAVWGLMRLFGGGRRR